jgi:RNA polymerase sigma factor (TIGR02999 family)
MDDELSPLLAAARRGDAAAREALFAAAYAELHQLARARLRGQNRPTLLDTTALVHESFLRFVQGGRLQTEERRAFFAYAGQVMRSVIVDLVRQRQAERRGGGADALTLDSQLADGLPDGRGAGGPEELLAVHEALQQLAAVEPRLARVVEMRYFAGLEERDIAETLGLTERSVRRDWQKARLMLLAMLG